MHEIQPVYNHMAEEHGQLRIKVRDKWAEICHNDSVDIGHQHQ
jgi:hypothetical protein